MRRGMAWAAALLVLPTGAWSQNPVEAPTTPPARAAAPNPTERVTLEDAIRLALEHNHALEAMRKTILQNQAQETTANLRPNPVLSWDAVAKSVKLPEGYRLDWGGEYSELVDAKAQLVVITPLAVFLIFLILFGLYGNFKFPMAVVLSVIMTEPVGALLALKITHTPFSASSVLGLLVLMGVAVETAVIDVSYINKLRLEGQEIFPATFEGSLVRLRPIMMTALVACLGLLPAAMSTGVGSDSQKPFAIVIVAGLVSRLFLGRIISPVLYQLVAREGDVLQV
jgi:multidrug efflux pump subunit AcrB